MRELVIGVATIIAVAGCTSSSDDAPKAKPTTEKSEVTIAADTASAMKEGRDYDTVATLPGKIEGEQAHYFGVSPDGIVYGATYAEDPDAEQNVGPGGMRITTRSNVILLDPGSGKVTQVSDGNTRTRPNSISGIDVNEDWVTWLEVDDAQGAEWTLYSYDRSTGAERNLGSEEDAIKADTGVLFEQSPQISGDQVVMATFAYGDESDEANQVLTAPLDRSAPMTELVSGATEVNSDPEGLSFVNVSTSALMFRDAVSGSTNVIDDGESECRTYRSGVLFTCDSHGSGTKVRVRVKDGTTTFGPFQGDAAYNYHKTGWVSFVTDPDDAAKIYAIDTDRMKLFKVADTQGGWQLMGNDMALVSPFNGAKGDITLIKLR